MYEVTIIGGGFYGCMIALYFKSLGKKVLVLEREADIMRKASFNNQARIHNGYHYPRAVMTAESSHRNYSKFIEDFPLAVKGTHLMTYLIAKGSKTSPEDFEALYKRIGSPLSPPSAKVMALINKDLIQSAYTVEEKVFDGDALRSIIWHRLFDLGVDVVCNTGVVKVSKGELKVFNRKTNKERIIGAFKKTPDSQSGDELNAHMSSSFRGNRGLKSVEDVIKSDRIINCAYAGINDLLEASGLPRLQLRQQSTVMPLIKVPREFRDLGVTIMDGNFFAVMPFPPLGLHTIHHVRLTPAPGEHEEEIIKDATRFIPCLAKAEHKGSIKEVKVLLTRNNVDDGRPSLFKKDYGFEGFDVVMGGKLDNIYEMIKMFGEGDKLNLNIVT